METPPALPPPKPPLAIPLLVVLLAPLAAIAVGFWLMGRSKAFELPLLVIGTTTVICSAVIAGEFSRRMGTPGNSAVGLGILMFVGMIAFYGVCCFVGCSVTFMAG